LIFVPTTKKIENSNTRYY